MRFTLLPLLTTALILSACGEKAPVEAPSVTIQTAQGPVQGVSTDGAIINFKGIGYAAPPVGDLRWAAPAPAPVWTGVKIADSFAPMCRQELTEGDFVQDIIDGHSLGKVKTALIKSVISKQAISEQSEDCLYLNVRTDNLSAGGNIAGAAKPVMVWIHGGGHQFGSGSQGYYQGNDLVEKGVVLVTINYRLGPMGYMAHPALSADSPNGVSGNYGLQDQIAALKWVRDNISAYGGDPKNVTIFGESAGGWSVTELMASPLASGLFHRAIAQSGSSTYHLGDLNKTNGYWTSGHEVGVNIAARLGLGDNPSAADLRAVPADAIIDLVSEANEDLSGHMHTLRDGYILPKNIGIAFRDGDINSVPFLTGYNDDEGTLFFDNDPEPSVWIEGFSRPNDAQDPAAQMAQLSPIYGADNSQSLMDLYQLSDPDKFRKGGMAFMGDEIFGINVRYAARQNAAAGSDTYLYSFTRTPPTKGQTIGAFHSAEIPFVFGTHQGVLGLTDDDLLITDMMQTYWSNFAKTGNPNGAQNVGPDNESLMEWAKHDGVNWMHFAGNDERRSGPITDYNSPALNALEAGLMHHFKIIDSVPSASANQSAARDK